MIIETIETTNGNIQIEQFGEPDDNDCMYRVHSPYESQSVETIEDAHQIAAEMETVLTDGWDGEEAQARDELDAIMTSAEIEHEFNLSAGTVRQAIFHGRFKRFRKASDRTILIRRVDAERRWGGGCG